MSKWPDGMAEKVIRMYREGFTQKQIAEALHVDRASVIHNLKKHLSEEERHAIHVKNKSISNKKINDAVYCALREKCVAMFGTTNMTITEIAEAIGTTSQTVKNAVMNSGKYTDEEYHEIVMERAMKSKADALHNNRKDTWNNGRYNSASIPEWVTAEYKKDSFAEHALVVCKHLGLTEIPKGYIVHHVNNDSKDNRFENLVLMTRSEHTSLHNGFLKGVTTISKESTLKWVEARRQGADYAALKDIVYSGQECPAADNAADVE